MKDIPFETSHWKDEPHWMVKSFFNYVYEQNALIPVLDQITQRHGYGYNEEFCIFPDPNDSDPVYHFEGVMFGVGDEEIIITEAECWNYVRHVAAFYASRHGAEMATIENFLKRIEH